MTTSSHCNRDKICLPFHITTRKQTSLPVHVVQKITIIRAQKNRKIGDLLVVFPRIHLNAFIDSTVDGGLRSVPRLFSDEPKRRCYDAFPIPRVIAREICVHPSWI